MTPPKVGYVLRQKDTGGHACHWPGCNKSVPAARWGCRAHWYMLPQHLRTRIWRAYRPGQEISKQPSQAYIEVAREVQEWIAANHPAKPSTLEVKPPPGLFEDLESDPADNEGRRLYRARADALADAQVNYAKRKVKRT